MVIVLFMGKKYFTANVGDSRAIMGKYGKEKWKVKELSRDHKPNLKEEKLRIFKAGGRVKKLKTPSGQYVGPYRVWLKKQEIPGLAMSRSMGDFIA